MKRKKIIIIGAGPAGLTAAYRLAQAGCDVCVYEASSHVGGFSRSVRIWGENVDLGPHRFFSKVKAVNDLFFEVLQGEFYSINRLTRIFYKGRFFLYPLNPIDSLLKLGLFESIRCLAAYCKARLFPHRDEKTLENWVVNRFGRRLYSIFFRTYTEKVWGIPCARIDADWASQRIKKMSLLGVIKSAFGMEGKKKHTSLIDSFNYPRGGAGALYEKMADLARKHGAVIHIHSPIKKVLTELSSSGEECASGVQLMNGEKVGSDFVISTMPLTRMVEGLEQTPKNILECAQKLRYRNTILVYINIKEKKLFEDNWIYIHSSTVQHGRITNFRNWKIESEKEKGDQVLCLEFWCFNGDAIWDMSDEDLSALARKELASVFEGEVFSEDMPTHIIKLGKTYPVYDLGYHEYLNPIIDRLNKVKNLYPIGRYGSFKYNNQDHSILMGLEVARKIIDGANVDLWRINSDSDFHEEIQHK